MPLALLAAALLHQKREPTIKALYERCRPSVVSIETEDADGEASGTGFFYGDGRTVVTSLHVILPAKRITVRDDRGRTWRPKTVAVDFAGDTAILGLGVETGHVGLPHAPSQEIGVGDEILVIGDPEGLRATLSTGVVSALRTEDGVPIVQITAPISHGSSGGPVLDRKGRVLGVVKAFLKEGQNLNVAVSTQVAKWVLARRDEMTYAGFLQVVEQATRAASERDPSSPDPSSSDPSPRRSGDPKSRSSSPSSETTLRTRLTGELARMYTALFIAGERWRIAWNDVLNDVDGAAGGLDRAYERMRALVRQDLATILDDERYGSAGLSDDADSRLADALRSLAKACDESYAAEVACLRARDGGDAKLKAANERQIDLRERRTRAVGAFSTRVTDDLGLDVSIFTEGVDPVVICAQVLGECDAFPDYDRIETPTIVDVREGATFRSGDVLTGIRAKKGASFVTVASWADLLDGLYEAVQAKRLTSVEFRVRRGTSDVVVPYGASG